MSIDGYIAKPDDPNPRHWASSEDLHHLRQHITQATGILVGGITYRLFSDYFNALQKPVIVLTNKSPRSMVPDNIKFIGGDPEAIANSLPPEGIWLLLGGAHTARQFVNACLVDSIILTVEPQLLGSGIPLFSANSQTHSLQLDSLVRLNQTGTYVVAYKTKSSNNEAC